MGVIILVLLVIILVLLVIILVLLVIILVLLVIILVVSKTLFLPPKHRKFGPDPSAPPKIQRMKNCIFAKTALKNWYAFFLFFFFYLQDSHVWPLLSLRVI